MQSDIWSVCSCKFFAQTISRYRCYIGFLENLPRLVWTTEHVSKYGGMAKDKKKTDLGQKMTTTTTAFELFTKA